MKTTLMKILDLFEEVAEDRYGITPELFAKFKAAIDNLREMVCRS